MEDTKGQESLNSLKDKLASIHQIANEINEDLKSIGYQVCADVRIDRSDIYYGKTMTDLTVGKAIGHALYFFRKELYEKGILKEEPLIPLHFMSREEAENGGEAPQ